MYAVFILQCWRLSIELSLSLFLSARVPFVFFRVNECAIETTQLRAIAQKKSYLHFHLTRVHAAHCGS